MPPANELANRNRLCGAQYNL